MEIKRHLDFLPEYLNYKGYYINKNIIKNNEFITLLENLKIIPLETEDSFSGFSNRSMHHADCIREFKLATYLYHLGYK